MDDFEHRIACLNVNRGMSSAMLVMVLEGLPKDARLVRVQDVDYRNSHLLYFQSCKFKPMLEGNCIENIVPVFHSELSPDGESRTMSLESVEWPIEVEFPALKRESA